MRIACLERDNVTRPSNPTNNGEVYTASFELYPFYEGTSYSYFKGLLNGEGYLRGHFCVVRTMLDKVAEESDWSDLLRRATEAQRLANEFNKQLGYVAITFQIPMLTKMDTVSDFGCLFRCIKPHDKRLKHKEFVTIEPYLDGAFRRFDTRLECAPVHVTSKSKIANLSAVNGVADSFQESDVTTINNTALLNSTSLTQAFSHFTWHATKTLVVCGLQGVSNGLNYTLTNPVIHSTDSHFGYSDGSTHSIADFFSHHRCNNICCKWETCGNTGKSQRHVNFFQQSEDSYPSKELN